MDVGGWCALLCVCKLSVQAYLLVVAGRTRQS